MNRAEQPLPGPAPDAEPHRVAFVTQWFPPEPVTPPEWIAASLRRRGFRVSVVTGVPNFPSGRTQPGYRPWRPTTETHDGVRVLHCPLYPSHDGSPLRRAGNYLTWAASASVVGAPVIENANVALVYSSPATAALPAMRARRRSGTPFVLLVQDIWPDSVASTGFLRDGRATRAALGMLDRFVARTYHEAAHIAVTSPGMVDLLRHRGVPAQKLTLVHNWVDESVLRPTAPDSRVRRGLGLDDDAFLLMYAGNHGAAQALDVVVDAVGRVAAPNLHLVLIGNGVEKSDLIRRAEKVAPGRIHFLPPIPPADMPATMAAADVQLVSLRDDPLFYVTMPSKVQGILACAQPVIAVAPGDAGRAVVAAGAGWHTPPGDVASLAHTIIAAAETPREELRAMGTRGRDYYANSMGESTNAERLAQILRAAATSRGK